ncbi:unnamed protein product [Pneumocystis jirovecii]|uniref:GPI ethanolamine phosphate transferase 2 n=1 Tax=Pneumocystis jirovecii TaxID=42068 RepID=L0PEJ3_PNEJI|nr:unnamed protein product [Pneumocystis jirovecii]
MLKKKIFTEEITLCIVQVISFLGILFFAKGFFPYKPMLHGFSEDSSMIQAPFNRLVFILIDALRSDFVFSNSSSMTFTQSLIFSGKAYPYTAYASPPTVTFPRIKALTTGSIPVFLDAVFNIAESNTLSYINQDSWPVQIVSKGRKIAMYGDDTWIRLFPGLFFRSEGTSSFYVTDFTEVDTNVTRNVYPEMQRNDWDVLILHYLGLDHIGHLGGPYSPHMPLKQIEMDHIIKDIYKFIEEQNQNSKFNTLMVICGDHGMNNAGNHGGSSKGETSVALLFISSLFSQKRPLNSFDVPNKEFQYYFSAQQEDIIPTLAFLLGFNIPKNSIGVVLPELLDLWQNTTDQLKILRTNYNQISKLIETAYDLFSDIPDDQSCSYVQNNIEKLACIKKYIRKLEDEGIELEYLKEQYFNYMKTAQNVISTMSTNYNTNYMVLGIILSIFSLLISVFYNFQKNYHVYYLIILGTIFGILMFASSYIEEEHQFWYYLGTSFCFFQLFINFKYKKSYFPIIKFFVLLYIAKNWNRTGQKFLDFSDIANAYIYIFFKLLHQTFQILPWIYNYFLSITIPLIAFFCKIILETKSETFQTEWSSEIRNWISYKYFDLIIFSRLTFFTIFMGIVIFLLASLGKINETSTLMTGLHPLLSIFLITENRIINIPLFLIFHLQLDIISSYKFNLGLVSLISLIFQHYSFFALGNSNSISSIDLSNAYIGIRNYNVIIVGILTYISNWSGPLWWYFGCFRLFPKKYQKKNFSKFSILLMIFYVFSQTFLFISCYILRNHIFIWTVFSPKILYHIYMVTND